MIRQEGSSARRGRVNSVAIFQLLESKKSRVDLEIHPPVSQVEEMTINSS